MIPKSFQLMGHTIKVKITKSVSEGTVGEWSPGQLEIRIKPVDDGISESYQEQIFWHELTHCIFDLMAYEDHGKDEALVDRIGQCLYQINKTMK